MPQPPRAECEERHATPVRALFSSYRLEVLGARPSERRRKEAGNRGRAEVGLLPPCRASSNRVSRRHVICLFTIFSALIFREACRRHAPPSIPRRAATFLLYCGRELSRSCCHVEFKELTRDKRAARTLFAQRSRRRYAQLAASR